MKSILLLLIMFNIIFCAHRTKEQWKSRVIYQLLTDRFAKDGDDSKITCNLGN